MSVDESFRSSDPGDEEGKEDEGGVHGDGPVMDREPRVVGRKKLEEENGAARSPLWRVDESTSREVWAAVPGRVKHPA